MRLVAQNVGGKMQPRRANIATGVAEPGVVEVVWLVVHRVDGKTQPGGVSCLVSWCFEPSQPFGIISGLQSAGADIATDVALPGITKVVWLLASEECGW